VKSLICNEQAASPCEKICKLDPTTEYCIVCGRTTEHIQNWMIYTSEQRSVIMKDLKAKRRLKNELGRID
jgi:predicted Fe-S protein YdhL (DUF1289 family)